MLCIKKGEDDARDVRIRAERVHSKGDGAKMSSLDLVRCLVWHGGASAGLMAIWKPDV